MKGIRPEDGFLNRSKQMIFATEQNPAKFGLSIFESFKLATALALASILLFVALGGLSYLGINGVASTLLTNLKGDSENQDFHIQLGQAKYDTGNQPEVGANTISEILKNLSL